MSRQAGSPGAGAGFGGVSSWVVIALTLGISARAVSDCSKDTDCKGDRICVKGTCTDQGSSRPPAFVPPPPQWVAPRARITLAKSSTTDDFKSFHLALRATDGQTYSCDALPCALSLPVGPALSFLQLDTMPGDIKEKLLNLVEGDNHLDLTYADRKGLRTAGVVVFASGLGLAAIGLVGFFANNHSSTSTASTGGAVTQQGSNGTLLLSFAVGSLVSAVVGLAVGIPLWLTGGSSDIGFSARPPAQAPTSP